MSTVEELEIVKARRVAERKIDLNSYKYLSHTQDLGVIRLDRSFGAMVPDTSESRVIYLFHNLSEYSDLLDELNRKTQLGDMPSDSDIYQLVEVLEYCVAVDPLELPPIVRRGIEEIHKRAQKCLVNYSDTTLSNIVGKLISDYIPTNKELTNWRQQIEMLEDYLPSMPPHVESALTRVQATLTVAEEINYIDRLKVRRREIEQILKDSLLSQGDRQRLEEEDREAARTLLFLEH